MSPRSITRQVDKGSDDTSKVTKSNLHCNSDTSLECTTDIIGIPCSNEGDKGICTWSIASVVVQN